MNAARRRNRSFGGGLAVAGLALVVAMLPVLTGCESDALADADGVLAPEATAPGSAMSPPTLAQITAGAGLTEAEARLLEPALARWRDEAGSMDRRRQGRRFVSGPGSAGVQGPLMHAFLQEAAAALDTDRFVAVVGYLAQRRDVHREQLRDARADRRSRRQSLRQERHGRRGDGLRARGEKWGQGSGGKRGAGLHRFLADLDLTRAQRGAVHDAMREAHRDLRGLHREVAGGDLTADGVRDRARKAVDGLRTSLQAALTADQFQAVVTYTRGRAGDAAQRRLERLDGREERHDAFLADVLNLADGQKAELAAVRDDARSRMRALLDGIGSGNVVFADAVYEGVRIHEDVDAAVRALLTADQVKRLDALEMLRRGSGPRFTGIYL